MSIIELPEEYHQAHAETKRFMSPTRGNPNWGRPMPLAPALATEFEVMVKQLQLTPDAYVFSQALHSWCARNKNRCYIPEWLLDAWNLAVEADPTGAA